MEGNGRNVGDRTLAVSTSAKLYCNYSNTLRQSWPLDGQLGRTRVRYRDILRVEDEASRMCGCDVDAPGRVQAVPSFGSITLLPGPDTCWRNQSEPLGSQMGGAGAGQKKEF
jgi:hypothetical protein